MALPLRPLSVHGAPFSVPRSTHLLVIGVTNRLQLGGLQDEKHAVLLCSWAPALSSILKLALRIWNS
eukprot:367717-Pelagomonas_calceolata.AAC.1